MVASQFNTDTTITNVEFLSQSSCETAGRSIKALYSSMDNTTTTTICVKK